MNARNKAPQIEKKGGSDYKPLAPAVEQASRVLFCLGENPEPKMPLTDICRHVRIYKSKEYSILNTLTQSGLVEKDPQTKTYFLGLSLIFLARNVLDNFYYPDIVAPFLQNPATETSATALFALIHDEHAFVVVKHEGDQNVGFSVRLGHQFHITLGAHGKMIGCLILMGVFPESAIKTTGPKVASAARQISYKLGATTEINPSTPYPSTK